MFRQIPTGRLKAFAGVMAVFLLVAVFSMSVYAAEIDWAQGKFTVASAVERPASQQERVVDCNDTTIDYKEYDTDELKQIEACVTAGDGVQIAHSISSGRYYIATPTSGTFVALQFYGHMSLIPGTTRVVMDINSELYIVYNILAHLDSHPSWDTHRIYSLNLAERDFPAAGVQQGITRYGISRNGRYVVYNAGDSYGVPGKLIRYDMETKENRVFGASPYSSIYSGYPVAALGVSDDGSTVVAGGSTDLKFWHITDSCLGPTEPQGPMNGYDTCPYKLYSQSDYGLIQGPDAWYPRTDDFHFDETGSELQFGYHGGASVQRTVTLYAPGHVDDRLDYLALGDSYSSGEGDTELQPNGNLKYYRNHTDDNGYSVVGGDLILNRPVEKCHISTRSYPYMLATGMELGSPYNTLPTKWQSIACSGATAWDVKEQGVDDYIGQGGRLKGYDYGALKAQALNEFIPGRQKQIEFVKKYQPKVITLTMGGNDVDFGGKINICVRKIETCDYATTQWREKMKNELIGQFENLSSLYSELSAASVNKAKVYVLGYPIFINGNPYAKCTNTFNLDSSEREFINNSIIYMNNIIEQAAKKAGVKYINIENAFGNHRLCDVDSQHVTAITNIFGANGNEQQEGFHPNHFGHVDIANAVWDAVGGQSLLDYQTCSDASVKICPDSSITAADAVVPPYFTEGVPPDDTEIHYYTLTNGTLVKMTETLNVNSGKYKFASETKVDITLYSDPTSLGQVTAASDGTASAQITIPSSVPAGYHTLVMRGIGADGKPLELYQTVEVRGPNPNDIDEDGIDDSVDKCAYITPLNIDADHDGIDDACDPEVNVPEAPYRVRLGDPARIYAGAPEKDNYLYLERRVNATTLTGVSGDNDPDGDGWAIVGASSGRTYSLAAPKSIPDTAPYANFTISNYDPVATTASASPIIPSIYLRAGDYGCVEYKPTSLSKVLPGEVRTLTLTAQSLTGSANHCRSEPATADADHDGQPDNAQLLYQARNGDALKGEDPTRIYLFRNFYAAEAQLGITDYSPTGTPANTPDKAIQPIQAWNLLATSKDVGYSPVVSKLAIVQDSMNIPIPYISAKKHTKDNPSSSICITYKPDTITQIKLATQSTRQLQLLKWKDIPGGVGCG